MPVDDLSSACRATKSLYRRLTVHVRIGVETAPSATLTVSRQGFSGQDQNLLWMVYVVCGFGCVTVCVDVMTMF